MKSHNIVPEVSRQSLPVGRIISTYPWAQAMLDVLQRRGRSYGLLAMYEESRLTVPR
ncbi:MAG: hypothetical protein QM776_00140 [Rhodocyclaceae bacterium]